MKLLCALSIILATSAFAGDVYLFQAHAAGPLVNDPAINSPAVIEWDTDAFFYNQGSTEARIEFLDDYAGLGFTLAPHASTSLSKAIPQIFRFIHASVPDTVIIENALFIGTTRTRPDPPLTQYVHGMVRLPVFTSIVPANRPQVHLATFMGSVISRHNVWVYNGGDEPATARIAVHRQCDDAVIDEATIAVPPRDAIVVNGMGAAPSGCPTGPRDWTGATLYTIVTVDQPSLSFVSTLANTDVPQALVSVN